jgi:hypothetical protein
LDPFIGAYSIIGWFNPLTITSSIYLGKFGAQKKDLGGIVNPE